MNITEKFNDYLANRITPALSRNFRDADYDYIRHVAHDIAKGMDLLQDSRMIQVWGSFIMARRPTILEHDDDLSLVADDAIELWEAFNKQGEKE